MAGFKKRTREATSADAPSTLGAWEMLHEDEMASVSIRLREYDPARHLTAFARRNDTGAFACFDKDEAGKNKGIVVLHHDGREQAYPSFTAWFDAAAASTNASRPR